MRYVPPPQDPPRHLIEEHGQKQSVFTQAFLGFSFSTNQLLTNGMIPRHCQLRSPQEPCGKEKKRTQGLTLTSVSFRVLVHCGRVAVCLLSHQVLFTLQCKMEVERQRVRPAFILK